MQGEPAAFANSYSKGMVGREEELARISAFVDTRHETPAALVIQGTAGIGKTTLWRDGLRRLEEAGFRVLQTTPAESEASLSLATLSDLVEPVYRLVRTDLPAPQRRVLDVALALEESRSGEDDGDRLLRAATLGVVRALSERTPLAIAIDDLQWVDPETAAALTFVLRRLRTELVLCLFALRLEGESAFQVGELGGLPVERLNVGPLSLGATQRLLHDELGATYTRPVVRRLVETSGGNPFYAIELARGLGRAGVQDEPPVLSQTLEALIADRMDGVSAAGRRLLGYLSLLPHASVALLDDLGILGALDEVVGAGIVRVERAEVRFDHPLIAAGAYARLGPEERRSLHAELASTLVEPVERALHLGRSLISESAEAATELAAGAQVASGRGQPTVAAELAAAAARVTPRTELQVAFERRLLYARYLVQAGALDDASDVLDEITPKLQNADERARALYLRARVTADIQSQRSLLLEALRTSADPVIGVEVNAVLVRNYLYSGALDQALGAARAADELAREGGNTRLRTAATTTRGLMEIWGTGTPDSEVFERALLLAQSGDDLPADTYSNPHTLLGARGLYRFETDEARGHYTLAAAAADIAGEVDSLETFWWGLAQLEVRAGRYDAAQEYVDSLRESGESFGRRPLSLRWIEGVLASYRGNVEEAREALEEALERAEAGENWFFVAYTRSALGFLELSLGDAAEAVAVLEPVVSAPFVVRGDPGQTGVLPLAAEAAVQTGALELARGLIDRLAERGRELDHTWCIASAARCRGLLLTEEREFDGAVQALDDARALFSRVPAPFERARTLLALGSTQRRARRRRDARETIEAALEAFEQLGTPLWSERARSELGRVGGRAPSRGELTPSEARVATLVSEGKTNKEVAAALFVTDRTVESALTQIYRKLGVRSRTELARKLTQGS